MMPTVTDKEIITAYADTIAQLRAEVDRLTAERDEAWRQREFWKEQHEPERNAEIRQLRAEREAATKLGALSVVLVALCSTCGGWASGGKSELQRENEELKQRILRLEARIAEMEKE